MRFNIRNYRREDFSTLLAIDQSCFPPGIAYTPFELKTYIIRRGSFTLVAEAVPAPETRQNSSILGFLVAERARATGHIITIDVRAEARRHRIGSFLLESADEQFRLWNC